MGQGWGSDGQELTVSRSQSALGQEVGTHYLSCAGKEMEARQREEMTCPGSSSEASSGSPLEQVKLKGPSLTHSFRGWGLGVCIFHTLSSGVLPSLTSEWAALGLEGSVYLLFPLQVWDGAFLPRDPGPGRN